MHYCSVVSGKISNDPPTKLSNVRSVHQSLTECRPFLTTTKDTGWLWIAWIFILEEDVLHNVDQNAETSAQPLVSDTRRSQSTGAFCREKTYIPFIFRQFNYCSLMISHDISGLHSSPKYDQLVISLFFLYSGYINYFTWRVVQYDFVHMWIVRNPHGTRPRAEQQRIAVQVSATGIVVGR